MNEDCGECADVIDAGTDTEVMQDVASGFADLKLHICGGEFFADFRSSGRHFVCDSAESLIESEPGFDADDEQIECVWELEEDFFLAAISKGVEDKFGEVEIDAAGENRDHPCISDEAGACEYPCGPE